MTNEPISKKENKTNLIQKAGNIVSKGNRTLILDKTLKKLRERVFLSEDRRREVYYEVDTNAMGNAQYYVLTVLSCIIATFGLLNNSAAVIIGAMIIAPLMNPVMGTAMGVVRGDVILLARSLKTLIMGVAVSIIVACVTASLIPTVTDSLNISEIIGRISPNILDIGIGLAAGAAGAYAISEKKVASSLAGVAIAVSLIPPLAVTGIGLCLLFKTIKDPSLAQNLPSYFKIFSGSFALCFANLVAINLAGIIVFTIFGFRVSPKSTGARKFIVHFGLSLTLVAVMALILGLFYADSLESKRVVRDATEVLKKEVKQLDSLAMIEGTPRIDPDYVRSKDGDEVRKETPLRKFLDILEIRSGKAAPRVTLVEATILSPRDPDENYDFRLRAMLEEKIGPVDLTLRFVNTTNMKYEH
ncbi:MAG: TIGR00341 family protein [Candidatus Eremiobacteraeota bacterium]|nr:TIGR00341 family protein [Candidatus Eremiobacteraeota bacterium]